MQRRHMIIPALLIAGSAAFAGRGLLTILPLGPDQPASASTSLVQSSAPQDLATREATLTAAEQRLAAIAARRPPTLPAVPAATSGSSIGTTRVASSAPAPAPAAAVASTPTAPPASHGSGGDDSRYEDDHDEVEHEAYEHETEGADDNGQDGGEHEDD